MPCNPEKSTCSLHVLGAHGPGELHGSFAMAKTYHALLKTPHVRSFASFIESLKQESGCMAMKHTPALNEAAS